VNEMVPEIQRGLPDSGRKWKHERKTRPQQNCNPLVDRALAAATKRRLKEAKAIEIEMRDASKIIHVKKSRKRLNAKQRQDKEMAAAMKRGVVQFVTNDKKLRKADKQRKRAVYVNVNPKE